jgi:hypothetical protein
MAGRYRMLDRMLENLVPFFDSLVSDQSKHKALLGALTTMMSAVAAACASAWRMTHNTREMQRLEGLLTSADILIVFPFVRHEAVWGEWIRPQGV